jgi:predicted DNA-binding transcriptional regulator AlpA
MLCEQRTAIAVVEPPLSPKSARSVKRRVTEDHVRHAFNVAAAIGGDVLLRGPEVCAVIGVSIATLYRMLTAHEFPAPISPTRGTKAWPMSVVQSWIKERIAAGASDVTN